MTDFVLGFLRQPNLFFRCFSAAFPYLTVLFAPVTRKTPHRMSNEVKNPRPRAIVAAVQLPNVSDAELESSLDELRELLLPLKERNKGVAALLPETSLQSVPTLLTSWLLLLPNRELALLRIFVNVSFTIL